MENTSSTRLAPSFEKLIILLLIMHPFGIIIGFVIGHTQNGAKYIDLFDRILHACDLDMIFCLRGLKILSKSLAPMFEKVSLNAIPTASPVAPRAAANTNVSTPKFTIAAMIIKAIRNVL